MPEQKRDDPETCGICGEPFEDGELAVQAARICNKPRFIVELRAEKFWAHPVCLFAVAAEPEAKPASEKQKSK